MGILALTYALEVQENGTKRLRDAPGQVGYYQSIGIIANILIRQPERSQLHPIRLIRMQLLQITWLRR